MYVLPLRKYSLTERVLYVFQLKRVDPQIVVALTHRHRFLTRKVDGTERDGPLYKRLLWPIADVILEWAHYTWLWYLCGTSGFLVCQKDVSP